MGFIQQSIVAILLMTVIALGITNFQYSLFNQFNQTMPTSQNPAHAGQNLSYMNQSATISQLSQNLSNKISPTNASTLYIPIVSDVYGVYEITRDITALLLQGPLLLFSFFGDISSELGYYVPDLGIYTAILVSIVLVVGVLKGIGIIIGRDV